MRRFLPLLLALAFGPAAAQDLGGGRHIWQVFLQRDVTPEGADRLIFVDLITGEETDYEADGERYTAAAGGIVFWDRAQGRVRQASPEGGLDPHPFLQAPSGARRIDWLFAPDGGQVAWTVTTGAGGGLVTRTFLARADGGGAREVLADGPRESIRAAPVAFSEDGAALYMDFQPDGLADFTPYPQFAGLFALDLASGEWAYLPDEPGCYCGAGFGGGRLLRLRLTPDLSGFDLGVFNLAGAVSQIIPAPPLVGYTQAGDILVSPDGRLAVYVLAQIQAFGRPDQFVRTVFMLVDLTTMTQRALTAPLPQFIDPLEWTEDNSAVIVTSRQEAGTWKLDLSDGRLRRIAEATYLGLVG